jgi:ABC-type Na+ efflux pump permease subunit
MGRYKRIGHSDFLVTLAGMTWLPVVEREMRVAARRPGTYRIRFIAVLAMLALFAYHMMDAPNRLMGAGQAGRQLLEPLALCAFFFAISIGVIATSDSVSEEKREGTLGLLFLTDLKGYDVILGKLAAHSMNAFYGLIAILPILGIPLLMGGVTFVQFLRVVLSLITAIVLSLAAGIFVSTHSRNERKAMVFTFLLLAAITCLPWLLVFLLADGASPKGAVWLWLMFSPGFAMIFSVEPPPSNIIPPSLYWWGLGWSWAYSFALFARAARRVPQSWAEFEPTPKKEKPIIDKYPAPPRRKFLDDNPFLWLAMRGEASESRVWLFILSIIGIWLVGWLAEGSIMWSGEVILPTVTILNIGLKIWIAGEASRRFVEDRRNNAFELLLSTPLAARQIILGQCRALVRQFLWPVVAVLFWEILLTYHADLRDQITYSGNVRNELILSAIFLPVDAIALGWSGMWFGMKSKSRVRAMLFSFCLLVVAPMILSHIITNLLPISSYEERHAIGIFTLAGLSALADLIALVLTIPVLLIEFRRMALATETR